MGIRILGHFFQTRSIDIHNVDMVPLLAVNKGRESHLIPIRGKNRFISTCKSQWFGQMLGGFLKRGRIVKNMV